MRIAVRASEAQREEWLEKPVSTEAAITFTDKALQDADVLFDLSFDENAPPITGKPVFVNAVVQTLAELPYNYIRLNAWPGFLKRNIVEVAARPEHEPIVAAVMNTLNWNYKLAPDVPGMIAARIVSMIINEAYYALGDKVSTKEEIDIAMKLGTNYPYGPFEWGKKTGLKNIYGLLKKMSESEGRYTIAPLLMEEAMNIDAFTKEQ